MFAVQLLLDLEDLCPRTPCTATTTTEGVKEHLVQIIPYHRRIMSSAASRNNVPNRNKPPVKRLARACTACHHDKRRCDGTDPCSNCYYGQKECIYMNRMGKEIPAPVQAHDKLDKIAKGVDLNNPHDAYLTYRTSTGISYDHDRNYSADTPTSDVSSLVTSSEAVVSSQLPHKSRRNRPHDQYYDLRPALTTWTREVGGRRGYHGISSLGPSPRDVTLYPRKSPHIRNNL
ncbi:hypothetical protein QCA50_010757 [Cerrena zonata]|uniref:Zn(2)-C6 fungal-type domain-containing protein n=1 Tax=Cerrena zonata TaxID=2478898 RepID=A0AAW0G831_9APHY